MSTKELIEDVSALAARLRQFERQYDLASEVLYDLIQQGRLDDGRHLGDFTEWAGLYEIYLSRKQALYEQSVARVHELPVDGDNNVRLEPVGA